MLNRSTRITARPARTAQRECTSVISLPRVWRIITDSRLPESRDRVRVSPESVACQPPTMIAHPPPVSLWPRAPSPRTMTSKLYSHHMSFPFYILLFVQTLLHRINPLLSCRPTLLPLPPPQRDLLAHCRLFTASTFASEEGLRQSAPSVCVAPTAGMPRLGIPRTCHWRQVVPASVFHTIHCPLVAPRRRIR